MKCGRSISVGETAYWETDKGVWHLECETPKTEHAPPSSSSKCAQCGTELPSEGWLWWLWWYDGKRICRPCSEDIRRKTLSPSVEEEKRRKKEQLTVDRGKTLEDYPLPQISLKYGIIGRELPVGEVAHWEADKGVWHLECEERGAGHAQQKRAYQISSPKNFYVFLGGIAILAFILGGLVLGPALAPNIAYFPAKTVERPVTLTLTETSLITVTQPMTQTPLTSALTQKWLNPSDSSVVSWTDASKYVGKTKTVEGTIVRTYRSSTNTIFLNFHDPYQGYFCGVIFASDLSSFPFKPEDFYRGKEVRISGLIKLYEGGPEIIVENPSQIEVAYMGYNYP